jgi:redox-sensitive bicupin YhaK (pirin superfamily)
MLYYRPARERGEENHGWLHSQHTFSFANYYDPAHMGFSVLRVINDDRVAPDKGFDSHSHKDMEIISYMLEGSIEHRDSMGNVSILKAGEIQRMSAGTGITHSEYNPSADKPLRFLQIWIRPAQKGVSPGYETLTVTPSGSLTALITPTGRDNTLSINQDITLYNIKLAPGETLELEPDDRAGYLHGISGLARLDELSIGDGDGAGFTQLTSGIEVVAGDAGFEGLWFNLPTVVEKNSSRSAP